MIDTSLDSFSSIKPTLGSRQKAVFDVLSYLDRATNSEIAKYMGLPINTITPRVNELRKKGLVRDAGKRICKVTGSQVHAWRIV